MTPTDFRPAEEILETPTDSASSRRRPSTRRGTEVIFWYFMRVSGLVLLFLALTHFALTHIVTDVAKTNFGFLSARWKNPLWRTFDWALLALALAHGVIGVRAILEDYVTSPRLRAGIKALLFIVVGGLFLLGTITIFTFRA